MSVTLEQVGQAFATAEDIRTGAGSLSGHVETIYQGVWVEGFTLESVAEAAGREPGKQARDARSNVGYWAAVGALVSDGREELAVIYGGELNLWNLVKSLGVRTIKGILADHDDYPAVARALKSAVDAKAASKAKDESAKGSPAKGEGKDSDAAEPVTIGTLAKSATPLAAKLAKLIVDGGTIPADDVAAVDAFLAAAVAVAKATESIRRSVDAKSGTDRSTKVNTAKVAKVA